MLRTRLWMGALLIALVVGVLVGDRWLKGAPFLLVLLATLAGAACFELLHLLPGPRRPAGWVCYAAVLALVASSWAAVLERFNSWAVIAGVLAAVVLVAFLVEMARFREAGDSVVRIALTVWLAGYLGLLPCFLAQVNWLDVSRSGPDARAVALALAIFVPKSCDIGAYFTGRLLGRHRMAPVLSPKKTWEGAVGGLVTAVAATVGINRLGPAAVLGRGFAMEVGFGLTVGLAGMLGDLAESLIKRDCLQKDASHVVPGFGGVLDVVDAVIFAAPVAYGWLAWC